MRKDNTKTIAILAIAGAAAWYFMSQRNAPPVYAPQYATVPPPPPQQSPNYQLWVDTVLKTFGQTAALWAPGGPFYKQPVTKPDTVIV